jgi:hypothetical protein
MPTLTTDGSALLPIIFIAGFFLLSSALGRRLSRLFGAAVNGSGAERTIIYLALGAGGLQFVPFALGSVGELHVTTLRIAAAVVGLVLVPDLLALGKSAVAGTHSWRRPDNWLLGWALALSPALLIAALIALAPSTDPDGLAYHLTVPKRWMHSGYLEYLPTYPYSNAPMGLELLFGWGLALAGDSAAKCIHLLLGTFAVAAIYLAGKRLKGPMSGAVPATIFLVGPAGVVAILGFSYVEGGAALATASAALAWLIWFHTKERGYLRIAAFLAGIAVTFKISAALFPVALGALSFLAMYDHLREQGLKQPFINAATAMAALIPFVVAPVIPWFTRAFLLTGNPFFPVLANHIPSRDLSAQLATQVDNYNRFMTWGNALGRQWTLEQRTHLLMAIGLVLLLIGIFAFFKLRGRVAKGTAVIVTITAIAQLSAAGLYFRYSLPLAAALMLPMVVPFDRWLARRPVMLAWIALTLVLSLVQARRSYLEEGGNFSGLIRSFAGAQQRTSFLKERLPPWALYERVNGQLPPNAGIMLSFYCGGFYIDRATFCAEMVQDSLRFSSAENFSADIRRLGITHLIAPSVLATGGATPYLGGSATSVITRADQFKLVRILLTQHARTLQTASDLGLYELDPAWLADSHAALDPSTAP